MHVSFDLLKQHPLGQTANYMVSLGRGWVGGLGPQEVLSNTYHFIQRARGCSRCCVQLFHKAVTIHPLALHLMIFGIDCGVTLPWLCFWNVHWVTCSFKPFLPYSMLAGKCNLEIHWGFQYWLVTSEAPALLGVLSWAAFVFWKVN